jgi:hypothetical protein
MATIFEVSFDFSEIFLGNQRERSTSVNDDLVGVNLEVLSIEAHSVHPEGPPELIGQVVPN